MAALGDTSEYSGLRILESMHDAVNYTQAVYDLAMRARPKDCRNVMEFGAGDGAFAKKFAAHGDRIDCVEIDAGLREILTSTASSVYADIREAQSARYDFLYSINVVEHIADLDDALSQLYRVVRPGGSILIFVPAFEMLWTSLDSEAGHVTRFTRPRLGAAFRKAGFEIETIRYFDSLGFPAALGVRLMEAVGLFRYNSASVKLYDSAIFPISQFLDMFLHKVIGKNLVLVGRKPLDNRRLDKR
jgi:SAM-dependent methyltransferase